jgi:release factor glutamine methyltransferase
VTWAQLHAEATVRLGSRQEARWLIEEVSGERWPPAQAATATGVSGRARARFDALVARRAAGEPLQYVLGRWQFRTLDLMVDRRVLIPRPETEQVVEVALAELDRLAAEPPARTDRLVAVDLGTGTGAIALSLAAERAGVDVWATDVSPGALAVAGANLAGLGGRAAARVRLAPGSWWAAVPAELRGEVDLVVSNPPYISSEEMTELGAEVVDWEPRLSLEAGPSGLEALGQVLSGARQWLRPGGAAVVEMAPHQASQVAALARAAGLAVVGVRPDLAGRERALVARREP